MRHMTKTTIQGLGLAALLLGLGLPGAAQAQITIGGGLDINVAFPEPPPLVVVRPGIQIVPEFDEEVYFTGGFYWVRRDDNWFRCRDYHGGHWAPATPVMVPVGLRRIPPGRFAHYYRDDDGRWRPHHREEWQEWRARHDDHERREWWREHQRDRMIRHEQERAWRDRQHEDRELERAEWHRAEQVRHDRERAEFQRRQDERRDRERNRPQGPPPGGHGGPPPGGHGGPPPGGPGGHGDHGRHHGP
jgi:hypothetical protein